MASSDIHHGWEHRAGGSAGRSHPAAAAPRKGKASTGSGYDLGYPQCGSRFPSNQSFGIVGVNGGLANDLNPCLGPYQGGMVGTSELYWAGATSTGQPNAAGGTQPKAGLYVNTADPGNLYGGQPVADWPTSGSNRDGTCTTTTVTTSSGTATAGEDSTACAYQYGWERAQVDAQSFLAGAVQAVDQASPGAVSTNPGDYPWWLDVETANTWQAGSAGLAMNTADLQGMADYFHSLAGSGGAPATVGVYSTTSQWSAITGGTGPSSPMWGLPDWVPGARTLSGAESNCSLASFTGGGVAVTQWFSRTADMDYACR